MRLAAVVRELEEARRAEALGFDAVWLDERDLGAPLVVAAAVAAQTTGLRLIACVDAGPHPVTLAEEAIVADLASNGRLVLVVRSDDAELLGETVEVLQLAFAARPFRHDGPRWRIPAGLPEHEALGERLRVTPAPAQLQLPVWTAGGAGAEVAATRGVAMPRVRHYDNADVERLRADEPDIAVLDTADLAHVAAHVRPRVQLDALPDGLEGDWDANLP
jgi:alkanesulfonate monooxygenase SsuD/methylene tetrahydromethanopterin reductase-like flavin-dependent oxidoreductase (luciferase family)